VRVLVVEDEVIIAAHIEVMIQDLGHDVVGSVTSGEEAILIAAEEQLDLVLMDVALRGAMNGIEAANQIRANSKVAIVFMSAYSTAELINRYNEPDSFVSLTKPISTQELEEVIRRTTEALR
jgi:CheY-like chemotaxis protein